MKRAALLLVSLCWFAFAAHAAAPKDGEEGDPFPVPIETYVADEAGDTLWEVLKHRVEVEPFNLVATVMFIMAVLHTFLTAKFRHWAHEIEHRHAERLRKRPPFNSWSATSNARVVTVC